MSLKEDVFTTTKEATEAIYRDPEGSLITITEIALAACVIVFIFAMFAHLYFFVIRKIRENREKKMKIRENREKKMQNCVESRIDKNGHHIDRIRSLEKSDDLLYSKIDKLAENQNMMNEKIVRMDTNLQWLCELRGKSKAT